jgi:protein TonB
MFETAAVGYGPVGNRIWSTCIGMTGECLLIAAAVVFPLMHPEVITKTQTFIGVFTPPTPPPALPERPKTDADAAATRPLTPTATGNRVYEPTSMPPKAMMIADPPLAVATDVGVVGGTGSPGGGAGPVGILRDILDEAARIPVPRAPAAARPAAPGPAPAPAAPIRVRQGGVVKDAVVIRRVEPVYPAIARQTRVAGVVRLEGVIGIDGRIRELKVLEGNPLLVKAAVDAVSQWLYEPTTLNGDPVEVIAPISVTFRLN